MQPTDARIGWRYGNRSVHVDREIGPGFFKVLDCGVGPGLRLHLRRPRETEPLQALQALQAGEPHQAGVGDLRLSELHFLECGTPQERIDGSVGDGRTVVWLGPWANGSAALRNLACDSMYTSQ